MTIGSATRKDLTRRPHRRPGPVPLANVMHEAAFRRRFDRDATRAVRDRARGRRNIARLDKALELNAAVSALAHAW